MEQFKEVSQPFYTRVIMIVSIIIIVTVIIASLFLYMVTDQQLEEGYAQSLIELSQYKGVLVRKSVFIYIGFGLFALVIVAAYGVYFSHKVTGPLVRVKRFASEMASGEYDLKVTFRQGDFIHVMAYTADNCAGWYRERHSAIKKVTGDIKSVALELEAASAKRESSEQEGSADKKLDVLIGKLDFCAKELDKVTSEIKV